MFLKKIAILILSAIAICVFAGCGDDIGPTVNNTPDEEIINIILDDSGITYPDGAIYVDENIIMITKGGSYNLSGTLSDGKIIVDTQETIFLTLNGANITSAKSSAIEFVNTGKAVIEIVDGTENRFSDGEDKIKKSDTDGDTNAVIYSNSDIELHGSGALYLTGNNRCGIHSNKSLDIYLSGELNIWAKNQGIFAQNRLNVHSGKIIIEQSNEGMECKGELVINDGNIWITSKDDALNAGNNLVVNGGYIYADCNGDGFDSNGNMTINGGEIYIFAGTGKKGNKGALDVSDGDKIGKFTINGGTIIAAGGYMKINVEANSKQNYVWIELDSQFQFEGAANAKITSKDGEEIIAFTFPKECELVFFSSDKINSSEIYLIERAE